MSEINACINLYNVFKVKAENFLSKTKGCNIKLGTLGAEGTTSSLAAKYLQHILKEKNGTPTDIVYYDNFEEVHIKLSGEEIDYALVPHAYERITDYYWDNTLEPILYFVYNTPKYGIYTKPDYLNNVENLTKKDIKIAACPAVFKLISILMPQTELDNLKIEKVNSTESAAWYVYNNICELAVTNESSAGKYGLVNISEIYNVEMSWAVFSKKKRRQVY